MSNLNKVLFLSLAVSIAVNFYMDHKRDLAMQAIPAKVDTVVAKPAEPSPFDKEPTDPLHSSQSTPTTGLTTISYEHLTHEFGEQEAGPKYSTSYVFKNTGHQNLFISECVGSCGCTVPSWPKEAIKPGETGQIDVEFDSKGRTGEQLKTITVTTNTEPNKNVLTLHIRLHQKK